jgi:RNA polymerase sigma-70 factor (ECF subfamily)
MGIENDSTTTREDLMSSLDEFNHHHLLLFSIAYRMLGTVSDAEDMVQETFLRWLRGNSFGEVASNMSYLIEAIEKLLHDESRWIQSNCSN